MRAKRSGAATPVKCNIINRFHQMFWLPGCWLWLPNNLIGRLTMWHSVLPSVFLNGFSLPHTAKYPARLVSNKWLAVLCWRTSSSDSIVLLPAIIISSFYAHVCRLRPWEIFHFLCFLGTGNTGNNRTARYTRPNWFLGSAQASKTWRVLSAH